MKEFDKSLPPREAADKWLREEFGFTYPSGFPAIDQMILAQTTSQLIAAM